MAGEVSPQAALFNNHSPLSWGIFHNYESRPLEMLLNARVERAQIPGGHPSPLPFSKSKVEPRCGVDGTDGASRWTEERDSTATLLGQAQFPTLL